MSSLSAALADAQADGDEDASLSNSSVTPDVRGSELKVKVEKDDFVIVPIPISNPTLDTGLVVAAAYFYPQTEQQKTAQPASVTGAAAMYTSNDSYAVGIGQESYWSEDRWRFTAAIGDANLELDLLSPDGSGAGVNTGWLLNGGFFLPR